MITISYIFLAFAIGVGIGRYRKSFSFQNGGETLVSREIRGNLAPPDFHLLNHITLRLNDGTTQIDHILVSRFGVFVIETKGYKGWIFANAKHATWTQVLYGAKFRFQNPIFQNLRHLRAVQEILDFLPAGAIKPVVVFAGDAEFKTDVPPGVFTVSELIEYLRSLKDEVMSLNRVQFCVGRLETTRLAISGETDLEHLRSLQRRHGKAN